MKNIIILNQKTGLPLVTQRDPIQGDWVRETRVGKGTGGKDAILEYMYHDPIISTPELPITITSIVGSTQHRSDFSLTTCLENTNVTISGTLDIPDNIFTLPVRRNDGRLFLFAVKIVNGKFDAIINFPTSGEFTCTSEEINEYSQGLYSINNMKFYVIRNI